MGVEYRKDRDRWGFRISLRGKRRKRFIWRTKEAAEREFREIQRVAKLPPTALTAAATSYLLWMHERRSKLRFKHVRYTLRKWIIPFFGAETLVTQITSEQIEDFMAEHKKRVSTMTLWHYVKDLNAWLNWCVKNKLLYENPVKNADRSELRYRVKRKLPMNPELIEKGAEALQGVHRAYYDFLRFTGARRNEGSKLKWEHLDFDRGEVLIPGTKTPNAADVRPISQQLVTELKALPRTSEYVFPPRHGAELRNWRKTFEKVSKYLTQVYDHPVKLTPKDLRDWFGTRVVSVTNDPRQIMELMRHTSLRTTTIYMRSRTDDLRSIVESIADGSKSEPKKNTEHGED